MGVIDQETGVAANAEAIEAWDGPLFDRFLRYRHIVVAGLSHYGDELIRLSPPQAGARVLDIGCGFGDMTRQLGEFVGPEGVAVGVDASQRFVEVARREAREAGAGNIRFEVADVQASSFTESFDMVFSRFGTMFFANPVAALRNVRQALVPGGRLAMVVWRAKVENDWLYRAQTITEQFLVKPEEYDEPTCGPGPFSMANADTTSGILMAAGFTDISLRRRDFPIRIGSNVEEAVEIVMALGPAGEILRLAGDQAAHLHEPIRQALCDGLGDWAGPAGVVAPASTWIVTAEASSDQL